MNLEQAKAKVDSIGKSTAMKHSKILIAELCIVVKFLLEEIDRIQSSTVVFLPNRSETQPQPEKMPQFPQPNSNPIVLPPKRREGNAGDAE